MQRAASSRCQPWAPSPIDPRAWQPGAPETNEAVVGSSTPAHLLAEAMNSCACVASRRPLPAPSASADG